MTETSATSIYQTIDCYDQQIDLVLDAYSEKATHEGLSPSGIAAAIGDTACGLVAAIGGSIFLIVLAFEVLMGRMLLDLVLGIGPIFIACAAFAPTSRFFEAWTAKVANYALLQVLVAAFLGMALTAFSTELAPFQVTTSPPGANAGSLVAAGQAALEASAAWVAALGMFATAIFLAMVGWQLPSGQKRTFILAARIETPHGVSSRSIRRRLMRWAAWGLTATWTIIGASASARRCCSA